MVTATATSVLRTQRVSGWDLHTHTAQALRGAGRSAGAEICRSSQAALACHAHTLGALQLLTRSTLAVRNKGLLCNTRQEVGPQRRCRRAAAVPSVQRRSAGGAGSQVRPGPQVKEPRG